MTEADPPPRSLGSYLIGPILIGLALALGKGLPGGWGVRNLDAQSPLVLAFFGGLLIALACRPLLLRVGWSRLAAMGVAAALLLGVGPLGEGMVALALAGGGAMGAPTPTDLWREVLGAATAAVVMGAVYRARGGTIGWRGLRALAAFRTPAEWAWRMGAVAAAAVGVWLALGWVEAVLHPAAHRTYPALVAPNRWLQLLSAEGGGAPWLVVVLWLRAVALYLPLLPLALVVRGRPVQITLMFGLLLFVVGDFAPLLADQPYYSTSWLLGRTALGAARAALLGWFAALLIGQIRPAGLGA